MEKIAILENSKFNNIINYFHNSIRIMGPFELEIYKGDNISDFYYDLVHEKSYNIGIVELMQEMDDQTGFEVGISSRFELISKLHTQGIDKIIAHSSCGDMFREKALAVGAIDYMTSEMDESSKLIILKKYINFKPIENNGFMW